MQCWLLAIDPLLIEAMTIIVSGISAIMIIKIVAIVGRPTRRLIELLLLASQCLPLQPHLGRSTEEIGGLVATVQAWHRPSKNLTWNGPL